MGQQRDQGQNQKITWNKWKWGQNNPIFEDHGKSSPKREIHSIPDLYQETGNISNKQSSFTLKETWKKTTKSKVSKRNQIKDQSRN